MSDNDWPYGFGYCCCGCGQKTNISRKTVPAKRAVRGQPRRFRQGHARRPPGACTPRARFERNVRKGGPEECWPWGASTDTYGYGMSRGEDGRLRGAHRLAWEYANGPIPARLLVLHRCDNPPCCNPAHLYLGTHKDNSDDKIARDRQGARRRGESAPNAKLTPDAIRDIRRRVLAGEKQRDVAGSHHISQRLVWNIHHRLAWPHITD